MSVDPAGLAALHAMCFQTPRPWTSAEFADWLADSRTIFFGDERAFVLGRVVLDEAELLTIAVAPAARRAGVGNRLVSKFERSASLRGAATSFLEVAADNVAAIALYTGHGYTESGRRKGYYTPRNAPATDAILLSKPLIVP